MTTLRRRLFGWLAGNDPTDDAPAILESDGGVYVRLASSGHIPIDVDTVTGPNRHLESEEGRAYRSQVALELMDLEVYGFMLLLLKGGPQPEVSFRAQTDPAWEEAFRASLAQIALAFERS